MSSKEVRRPGLIQAALAGKVTNAEAARALGLSVRQFRRLKSAYQRTGVEALIHGNRGRPSPRRRSEAERQRIVELMRTRYAGLNDCHLTEKLCEWEGLSLARATVRRIRLAARIPAARRRRAPKYRARRERETSAGALVLLDGSPFSWLGPDQPVLTLVGAIDDATGCILALHFRPHEDLHGYTELLHRLIVDYGIPCNLYGDRFGVFVRNDRHWSIAEELEGHQRPTQFGQMLAELAIGYIPAQSPQAKGRIERLWQTLQGRLPAELRLRSIATVAAAQTFLPEFIADFNRRFGKPPRQRSTAWRRPPHPLDHILACRYLRTVAADNTVSLPGRWIQIPPGPHQRSYRGCQVEARELLDGRLIVLHQGRLIALQDPPAGPFTLTPRESNRRQRLAALGIDARESPRIASRDRPRAKAQALESRQPPILRRPKSDHPWRQGYDPSLLPRAGAERT